MEFENIRGAISLQSARLVVQPDKTLALVGGNVSLDNSTILALQFFAVLFAQRESGTVAS
ncbi:MAG: hypothetical protein RMY34_14030 [Aulosira sp. DedQUE10]|nr:hypothetical protein [Aulosira sp. DedQUE10]